MLNDPAHLPRRSRAGLAAAEAARRLAPAAGHPQGGRGVARAHRPAHRHPAPAPAARRAAAGDRQPRAQDGRGARPHPRARPRLRRGLAGPRDPRGDREGAQAAGRRSCRRATGRPSSCARPGAVVDMLRTLLRLKAEQAGVAGAPGGERRRDRPPGRRQARRPRAARLAQRDLRQGRGRPDRGPGRAGARRATTPS